MANQPLHEQNSPFTGDQVHALNTLLGQLSPEQRLWLSGYLAAAGMSEAAPASPTSDSASVFTILYGTETGNARGLAQQLQERVESGGYRVEVSDLADFKPRKLKEIGDFAVITSTHGEGDPPEPVKPFYEFLHGRRAPALEGKHFAVLSLGDSSYEHYCQTGKDFDVRFEALGASRLVERVDCDVDFDDAAEAWMTSVVEALGPAPTAQAVHSGNARPVIPAGESVYSRKNPFPAEILENINLNDEGSGKVTRHVEISLEGSGLTYAPGDALGIVPSNAAEDVDALLELLQLDPEASVQVGKEPEKPLRDALLTDLEITRLTPPVIRHAAEFCDEPLGALAEPDQRDALRAWMQGRTVIDLFREYPPKRAFTPQEFAGILRKMPPRLYSIASSLLACPEEVHLTVALDSFDGAEGRRQGVASRQLHEAGEPGTRLPVYVQSNEAFRLPEDPSIPVIMVGPGTGVAPFRAFLQEREERGGEGKSWLFFGDRHFRTDFLYQTEWQRWLAEGTLTRMDVAFSRDQEEKVYVQDRMRERARDLFAWLEEGAYFYVCGDESRMAPDVHEALIDIVATEGNRSREEAEAYVEELKTQKRYRRDVY